MVTVDEIRARVEAADQVRIQARAEAAAKVAEGAERRATASRELAELDAVLAADVAAAEKVMTMAELVDFTGLSEHDLAGGGVAGRGRQARRRTTGGARTPRSRRTPAATTATDSPAG